MERKERLNKRMEEKVRRSHGNQMTFILVVMLQRRNLSRDHPSQDRDLDLDQDLL